MWYIFIVKGLCGARPSRYEPLIKLLYLRFPLEIIGILLGVILVMQCTSSMLVFSIAWGSMKQKGNGSVWIKPEKSRWQTFWIRQGVTDVAEERMRSAEKIVFLHGVLRSEQNNDKQSNIVYLIRGETLLMNSNRWWKLVICHGRMCQIWKKNRTASIFSLRYPFYQQFTNISGEPDLQYNSPSVREDRWAIFCGDRSVDEHDAFLPDGHARCEIYSGTRTYCRLLWYFFHVSTKIPAWKIEERQPWIFW